MKQQKTHLQKDIVRRQENVDNSPNSQSQSKDKQSRPNIWMGARVLKEQTQANVQVVKYICTPNDMYALAPWQTVLMS